jgi:hypothetical protein
MLTDLRKMTRFAGERFAPSKTVLGFGLCPDREPLGYHSFSPVTVESIAKLN